MKKINKRVKFVLFFSAYFPLFLIIAVKNYTSILGHLKKISFKIWEWSIPFYQLSIPKEININSILIMFPLIISFITVLLFLGFLKFHEKGSSEDEYKVLSVKDTGCETISYILTYIISFLDFNLIQLSDIFCIYILLGMIAVIYVNTDMIYTNPWFYMFGYNIFEIDGIKTGGNNFQEKVIVLVNYAQKDLQIGAYINSRKIKSSIKDLVMLKDNDIP